MGPHGPGGNRSTSPLPRFVSVCRETINDCHYRTYDAGRSGAEAAPKVKRIPLWRGCCALRGLGWSLCQSYVLIFSEAEQPGSTYDRGCASSTAIARTIYRLWLAVLRACLWQFSHVRSEDYAILALPKVHSTAACGSWRKTP
jgi:hypothetical protein